MIWTIANDFTARCDDCMMALSMLQLWPIAVKDVTKAFNHWTIMQKFRAL